MTRHIRVVFLLNSVCPTDIVCGPIEMEVVSNRVSELPCLRLGESVLNDRKDS